MDHYRYIGVYHGKENFVKFLVPQYCKFRDFIVPNDHYESSLYLACKNGHTGIVSYACVDIDDLTFNNVCHCILVSANWEIAITLFNKLEFCDFATNMKQKKDHTHLIQIIPNSNDNIEFKHNTTTVLHIIAVLDDVTTLQHFTDWDINCLDSESNPPLHIAIKYNCITVAKYLIDQPRCNLEY